jgi:hypothetical protein
MVRLAAVALLATALVVAGCGSDYRYVSNRKAGAFFKVPDSWHLYEEEDLLRAEDDSISEEDLAGLEGRLWLRGFDAADDPAPEHVVDVSAGSPRGYAEVRQLTGSERDALDYGAMRRTGFPLQDPNTGQAMDPLVYADENPDGPVTVLEYDDDGTLGELELGDGLRGMRLVTRIALEDEDPLILEQVTVVDADTRQRYSFSVGCTEDCWDANEDVIRVIADSWTLEEAS